MSRFVVRGNILLGSRMKRGMLLVEDGKIAGIRRREQLVKESWWPVPVYQAAYVAPGFVDLQVNGGFGVEVGDDPEAIRVLARRLPETGVTAFLPTIVTAPTEYYPKAITAFEAAKDTIGARPLGLHMEGPFLSPARHGAHRRDLVENADPRLIDLFVNYGAVRLVTLAPERPGALEMISKLAERNILVSLGHTDATFEQFVAGVGAGARMATHLYNAMSPFTHRAPGAIGAALLDERVTVGLIADGIHSHPASLSLAYAVKHPARIALVTDMMAAAGMLAGTYALGGQEVIVNDDSARLADGTLAGAIVTMDQTVRNMHEWGIASEVAPALQMASEVPAGLIGMPQRGRIREGEDADLVLLDGSLNVQATIINGEIVYQREAA